MNLKPLEYVRLIPTGCKGRVVQWYPVTVKVWTDSGSEAFWLRHEVESITAEEWFAK